MIALTDLLKQRMQERTLARLWREEAPRLPWLECADGRKLRVLYPGRPAIEGGPDLRDVALLAPDGTVLRGDVELHLRLRGWQEHGHDHDPRYNSTVLHIVLYPDSATVRGEGNTRLEAGVTVPIISLFPVLQRLKDRRRKKPAVPAAFVGFPDPPDLVAPSPTSKVGVQREFATPSGVSLSRLNRAGDARFAAKRRAFAMRMQQAGPDQALYEGVMEALGYYQNREQFRALAQRVPYAMLRSIGAPAAGEGRALLLEETFLGAAGFVGGTETWWRRRSISTSCLESVPVQA